MNRADAPGYLSKHFGARVPRIFDNLELVLHPYLDATLATSTRADFCVGYFNLRGWKLIDKRIDTWAGTPDNRCRLLVGMQRLPQDELRDSLRIDSADSSIDLQRAAALKQRVAAEFREQLTYGTPTNDDEAGLRRLSAQLRTGKLEVRLYLREPLHAKLYLVHREDLNNPTIGFLGSSNLTFSGLRRQGELNIDVLDHDACAKLQSWFDDRWADRFCIDISAELADVIDESWATPELRRPYHIYIKMAYHLSQEARAGLNEYGLPRDFRGRLLEFQSAAVRIAAHHLNRRGGVIIGDVVGLGKTLMATALARLFQDDQYTNTLIICPANLVRMWQSYVDRFGIIGRVVSLGRVLTVLPELPRYRVVLIDESHNLRNREGRRYRAIRSYIEQNESKCILISATPYNKSYEDLGAQLRLFIPEHQDLGVRPERLIRELGETEFIRRYQAAPRTLAAFEKSPYPDDWRDLMRLYLVRRTRGFIEENYAQPDPVTGLPVLYFPDGETYSFPRRIPRTVPFPPPNTPASGQYDRLYSDTVVNVIGSLQLPRYGLAAYVKRPPAFNPTDSQAETINRLSRAGARLIGFSRTNLFKRLESGGPAFLQSIYRHVLRNQALLFALRTNNQVPIGTLNASVLDTDISDQEPDEELVIGPPPEDLSEEALTEQASVLYQQFSGPLRRYFRWLPAEAFTPRLARDLTRDSDALVEILRDVGSWDSPHDGKFLALNQLITELHPAEKILIFTQFADTARYLEHELRRLAPVSERATIAAVTGESPDPSDYARRFSPDSNEAPSSPETDLRVLVATDVLSEGQNLQDAHVIVNYDIPWAIIRLIQRAGRVDRLGQRSLEIICYSFLPVDGVERLLRLRSRVRQRLLENASVLGTDESFFEDDPTNVPLEDLYNEKAGILDAEADNEVDLASYAYQIWKNAIDSDPSLEKLIPGMPAVSYATRKRAPDDVATQDGVLVYVRTANANDALVYMSSAGLRLSNSQLGILRSAECRPATEPEQRVADHHDLVRRAVDMVSEEDTGVGGQLGRPSGARFRCYERLKRHADQVRGTLFETPELLKTIDDIYKYPLQQSATDTINRQLRAGISDDQLAALLMTLREDGRLSLVQEAAEDAGPEIICSMGLI
jgi:hypothetical protein